ncbi:heavy-metal-associated domain-containing protein [Oceaniglobus indicus]|uniref:heavy-metal-associated domain-containing protein n=1 Tax=Oceaniglobus indicus TaxID=2047749 RepID=UPI000C1A4EB9|nr:heavy-metal-associated domain-containing protein [Oceaniglobus indicus]
MKFNVPEMSCGHCTGTIEKAVTAADANATVTCELSSRTVTVESGLPPEQIADVIRTAGYEPQMIAA